MAHEFVVYPAIDLRGGRCVRLTQGDYNRETVYGEPGEMAAQWQKAGAQWLHVVDLDGAKEGRPVNLTAIRQILSVVQIPVQVGGGIRNLESLETLLDLGVKRVILGSSAVVNRPFVEEALRRYGGERVVLGLDAREGRVAIHGWLETSDVRAADLALELSAVGAQTFIYTDISRDGMLSGPNLEGIRALAETGAGEVIASGGVRGISDLLELQAMSSLGVSGAIVGKALYTGDIRLEEALAKLEEGVGEQA